MLTKAKWLGVCFAILIIMLAGLGLYHKLYGGSSNASQDTSIGNAYKVTPEAQKEAIEQAKAFKGEPGEICTTATVPAVHTESGAEYTFNSGCLPPGWIPVEQ